MSITRLLLVFACLALPSCVYGPGPGPVYYGDYGGFGGWHHGFFHGYGGGFGHRGFARGGFGGHGFAHGFGGHGGRR
jgi:hypothetical protein